MRTADELLAQGNNSLVYLNNNNRDFWIVRIYTPVLLRNSASSARKNSDRPSYASAHQKMQANIQFSYTVNIFYERIDVQVRIHKLWCDVTWLVPAREGMSGELKMNGNFHLECCYRLASNLINLISSCFYSLSCPMFLLDVNYIQRALLNAALTMD